MALLAQGRLKSYEMLFNRDSQSPTMNFLVMFASKSWLSFYSLHHHVYIVTQKKIWECRGQSLKSVVCSRPQSKERHSNNEKVKSASLHSWLSLLSSLLHSSWHTCSPKRTPSGIPPWTMCVLTTWTTPCPTTGSLLHTTRKNPAHIITTCQALPVVSGPWENWSLASALENL